ncbi:MULTISPECIES: hypothetical protein [Nonomuraea]|jgi:hypothetical protein|uniref:Uncharacterized protein n=2 Tax=Nonomuraea TaxID=83681 RepID=A0ABV5QAQ6_9ACTN
MTDHSVSEELRAMERDQCTACLGTAEEEIVPGYNRPCRACAGTGRRREQLIWQLAHDEAAQLITLPVVRDLVKQTRGPFRLSEIADAVRAALNLPVGRLPVGPRVRDLLLDMQAADEIVMVSAPDELLEGTEVVLHRDPAWERVRTLGA